MNERPRGPGRMTQRQAVMSLTRHVETHLLGNQCIILDDIGFASRPGGVHRLGGPGSSIIRCEVDGVPLVVRVHAVQP